MNHVRALFLCGVMNFSYYMMFIHNMFIFQRKDYCGFCLPQKYQHAAVHQLRIKYDQDKFRVVF